MEAKEALVMFLSSCTVRCSLAHAQWANLLSLTVS
jgi:hypothetical protein